MGLAAPGAEPSAARPRAPQEAPRVRIRAQTAHPGGDAKLRTLDAAAAHRALARGGFWPEVRQPAQSTSAHAYRLRQGRVEEAHRACNTAREK